MMHIDEWNKPPTQKIGQAQTPAGAGGQQANNGKAQAMKPGGAAQTGNGGSLVDLIRDALMAMKPEAPIGVHFYLGEGLRWIRVGFDAGQPIQPSAVRTVGEVIASCIGGETLYFHALRPYDLLFFLEGGRPESVGMPSDRFGIPLADLLTAWKPQRAPAARKAATKRRTRAR